MSIIFRTLKNPRKLRPVRKSVNNTISFCQCFLWRNYSDVQKKFVTFDEVVAQRRAEARRSLVVQVNSESSFNELFGYCSKYAKVDGIHHYKNNGSEHFMLIEFKTEENLNEVVRNCAAHQKDIEVMAIPSPFLWFRAATGENDKIHVPDAALVTKDGNSPINEDVLFDELMNCNSVSDQIQLLYNRTVLNDLGVRLRYMVARQLEVALHSLYANIAVRPFGSSVNGFGKMGCDLDLVVTNELTEDMTRGDKRLVYQQGGGCGGGTRGASARHAECAAGVLELRVPGALRVQRILHARVPILKYAHDFAALDCDLCYTNMSGVYMSELLWLLGSADGRVRALAFAVRRWAHAAGLTNKHPGRWITNFPLTLMVLFFLQRKTKQGAVLPTFKYLVEAAGKEDIRIAEENLDCTFVRDLNALPSGSFGQNPTDLANLLLEFFEFYAQFDFHEKAISINEGVPIRKPNSNPLYIVNPLEKTLNVSRNVSFEECERLKSEVRNAAWQLESSLEGKKTDDWGILSLFERKSTRGLKRLLRVGNSHRLISVKDLFTDDDKMDTTNKSKDKLNESAKHETSKEQKMKFKNSQVAKEVYRIRRDKIQ